MYLSGMDTDIRITAEPADNHRCKFVVNVPLLEGGVRRFTSPDEAAGSALAEAVMAVEHVTEVMVSGSTVTVTKSDTAPWQVAGKAVGAALRAAIGSGLPLVAPKAASADPVADDELFSKVSMIFDTHINPSVASHGGRIELIDVQDHVVMVRLQGGCQGCGMAEVTLRQGIESTLRRMAPEVEGLVDVTDHQAGRNPFFASAKK